MNNRLITQFVPIAPGVNQITGTAGDDALTGTEEQDLIEAGAGNDTISETSGSDTIYAGTGNDTYLFSPLKVFKEDVDFIDLGEGDDTAYITFIQQQPLTTIHGGAGFDTIYMLAASVNQQSKVLDFRSSEPTKIGRITIDGFERVWLEGNERIDKVFFGDYDDHFEGYGNFSTIYGGGGNDYLDSGEQGDVLFGEDGDDIIIADGGTGPNPPKAFGGDGNDLIFSTFMAADYNSHGLLTGGDGKDGFILGTATYPRGEQEDYITDFSLSDDWIGLGTDKQDPSITKPLNFRKYNVLDTKSQLSFEMKYSIGDEPRLLYVVYDRVSGELSLSDAGPPYSDFHTVLVLKGRPYLTLDHFFLMSAQSQTSDDDVLHGNKNDDHLEGWGGSDTIYGLGGNDRLYGDGKDFFNRPGGGDKIYGGTGNDYIDGEEGDDYLDGGSGDDIIYGGIGNDLLQGGAGADELFGGSGRDTAIYSNESSRIIASLQKPSQNAGGAKGDSYSWIENLTGSKFSDVLTGNSGSNTLSGADGHDKISGGLGKDFLTGDQGRDRFIFDTMLSASNVDTITDFVVREDKILLDMDVFADLGKTGTLAPTAFYTGSKAHDSSDRIIYDKSNGTLWYDTDGSGKDAAVQFAQVTPGLILSAGHFDIIA